MKRRRYVNPFSDEFPKELIDALVTSARALGEARVPFVVIGGMAIAFHFPRYPTDDVDFSVRSEAELPDKIDNMKRLSKHMFEAKSGVVVDIVTPKHVRVPAAVFDYAFDTATVFRHDSGVEMRVASPLALFAMKLARARIKDQAHLIWMLRHGFKPTEVELLSTGLEPGSIVTYHNLLAEATREAEEESEMGWREPT